VRRRVVRAALAGAVLPARKVPVRTRPVSGPWEDTVRGWLEADVSEPRKVAAPCAVSVATVAWGTRWSRSPRSANLVRELVVEIGLDSLLVTVLCARRTTRCRRIGRRAGDASQI
jgi:hypothetical protein